MHKSGRSKPKSTRRWRGISFRLLLRAESVIRPTLYQLFRIKQGKYTHARVEMLLRALRLQAMSGRCFASASYLANDPKHHKEWREARGLPTSVRLAGPLFHDEKSWDRLLAVLRSYGLVTTTRLKRDNGQLGVNLIDLRGLWFALIRRLGRLLFETTAKIFQVIQSRWSLRWKVRLSTGYTEITIWPLRGPPVPAASKAKGQIS